MFPSASASTRANASGGVSAVTVKRSKDSTVKRVQAERFDMARWWRRWRRVGLGFRVMPSIGDEGGPMARHVLPWQPAGTLPVLAKRTEKTFTQHYAPRHST